MIKVFEAFAGIGSQRMALNNIGLEHDVVAISEIDKFAIASYEAIHGETYNLGDISKVESDDIPDCDLFTYSFPCQDISVAGKQRGLSEGSDTRSSLLWECKKVIRDKKPSYLLLENVKNLVGKKHIEDFNEWLEWLESQGYSNYWKVLNGADYNIPHNRERVFVVSMLGEHDFESEEPVPLTTELEDLLVDQVDDKYWLSDKIQERYHQTKIDDGTNNVIGSTAPDFRTIGQRDLVYSRKGVMGTLMATDYKQPKQIIDGDRVRKVTPLEYWRLQGIRDGDFYKAEEVCSDTQLYKQAGNSIPVPVLESIFRQMFKHKLQAKKVRKMYMNDDTFECVWVTSIDELEGDGWTFVREEES